MSYHKAAIGPRKILLARIKRAFYQDMRGSQLPAVSGTRRDAWYAIFGVGGDGRICTEKEGGFSGKVGNLGDCFDYR